MKFLRSSSRVRSEIERSRARKENMSNNQPHYYSPPSYNYDYNYSSPLSPPPLRSPRNYYVNEGYGYDEYTSPSRTIRNNAGNRTARQYQDYPYNLNRYDSYFSCRSRGTPDPIHVGGLSDRCTEPVVRNLLESFGTIRGFHLITDKESGNYAYCDFNDKVVTDIVCAALNGIKFGDRTISVRRVFQAGGVKPQPKQQKGKGLEEEKDFEGLAMKMRKSSDYIPSLIEAVGNLNLDNVARAAAHVDMKLATALGNLNLVDVARTAGSVGGLKDPELAEVLFALNGWKLGGTATSKGEDQAKLNTTSICSEKVIENTSEATDQAKLNTTSLCFEKVVVNTSSEAVDQAKLNTASLCSEKVVENNTSEPADQAKLSTSSEKVVENLKD